MCDSIKTQKTLWKAEHHISLTLPSISYSIFTLEKKFNSAIKNLDSNKFYRGVNRLKELKDVKNSLTVKQGEFQDEDE